MTRQGGNQEIMREFRLRRKRQFYAILATIFLLITAAWKQSHTGLLLGRLSGSTVFWVELVLIGSFVIFSLLNWRCPACRKYLGRDINLRGCRKCGTKLR
jgi:hypothetical protein